MFRMPLVRLVQHLLACWGLHVVGSPVGTALTTVMVAIMAMVDRNCMLPMDCALSVEKREGVRW